MTAESRTGPIGSERRGPWLRRSVCDALTNASADSVTA